MRTQTLEQSQSKRVQPESQTLGRQPACLLSVVIPVHDEVENIGRLVEETRRALKGVVDFEIVVVDDGSCDGSHQVLERMQGTLAELRLLSHSQRCGQSTAVWHGVRHARGALIATLDGDGQNDPADIPTMLQQWRLIQASGRRAMIVGHRQHRLDSRWRRVCSRLANGVRRRLLHDETPDSGCGIKLFDANLFGEFPYFDHMHRFLPALARRHGAEVASIRVNHRPRQSGRSHYGTWDRLRVGIVDLFGVMWLIRRSQLPVRLECRGADSHEDGFEFDLAGDWAQRSVALHSTVSRTVA